MARLFYIIGPSGAGKDSLIHYLRQRCRPEHGIAFAHRYITRQADAGGENHVALSEDEFIHRKEAGFFSMDWYSHGTHYGIGIEVEKWLSRGISVVVNGSRSYLSVARKRFDMLYPILIHVDTNILRDRLVSRGRESEEQIEKRLAKAQQDENLLLSQSIPYVENNHSLEKAGEKLFEMIVTRKLCAKEAASLCK
ncbi:hypothetical protein A3715_20750 [Oleiphilus sp. HI0009]|nr:MULTISPECIES: phosphonate metabolism protein/1,5-bisphosphokinase (PRPP-forming) PhnN [unclassified Oleiphilus]KZX75116.1 hypothetical protein A3715_02455 [Oleiphilus sp. HI0009]KZZ55656.1 hypothetical protein A3762_11795 [Oleiphilus sp. HI0125]KZX77792.1 hypothetical protein A3715_20750 [Oleiphilus sp. HI0009]KZY65843.1 hypothetical protein A3738_07760 [Oleiphilus sp. HI0066]KZY69759.1 hypothetical protein A3739_08020 [Oleiphilus sp. HI0067]